jgi:hypothetical protein
MQASGSQPDKTSAKNAVGAPAPGTWRRTVPITLVAAAVAGLAVWGLTRPAPPARKVVSRFAITPLAGTRLTSTPGYDIAISPDGTQVAYFAAMEDDATRTALYVRSLDELAPKVVAGTQGIVGIATSPFFSPDGRSIGFGTARNGIARIALGGGAPRAIVESGTQLAGGAWSSDDTVIFSSAGALYSVSARGGGTPERLTAETAQSAVAPTLLPGGRAVLYTGRQGNTPQSVVLDLETGKERIVVEDATNAKYTPSGHLVFARGATLMAAPFDLGRLVVTGEPVTLVEHVRRDVGAAADYALSDTGTLVYVPEASAAAPTRTVSWIRCERSRSERARSTPLAQRAPTGPHHWRRGGWRRLAVRPRGPAGDSVGRRRRCTSSHLESEQRADSVRRQPGRHRLRLHGIFRRQQPRAAAAVVRAQCRAGCLVGW